MISYSPEETKALGRRVAGVLNGGENLCLVGDLGSGKTLFAQGLAEGLGITEPVKSPTYTFLREYDLPARSTKLAHFDLYRLPDRPTYHDLDTIELFERMKDPDVITVIEWAEKLHSYLEGRCLPMAFTQGTGESERKITLPKPLLRMEKV